MWSSCRYRLLIPVFKPFAGTSQRVLCCFHLFSSKCKVPNSRGFLGLFSPFDNIPFTPTVVFSRPQGKADDPTKPPTPKASSSGALCSFLNKTVQQHNQSLHADRSWGKTGPPSKFSGRDYSPPRTHMTCSRSCGTFLQVFRLEFNTVVTIHPSPRNFRDATLLQTE